MNTTRIVLLAPVVAEIFANMPSELIFKCSDFGCSKPLIWGISNGDDNAATCNDHVGEIAGTLAKRAEG